jgi:alpha-galactosidase
MVWPQRIDRAVTGGRLRAGGKIWTQGIGVHAPSRLQWSVAPGDCRFEFGVALDESSRQDGVGTLAKGSVEFQVWLDGKNVWSSGVVTQAQGVLLPDGIDVRGAQLLELVVTDGGDGPVLDRANWLRPIMIGCEDSETR